MHHTFRTLLSLLSVLFLLVILGTVPVLAEEAPDLSAKVEEVALSAMETQRQEKVTEVKTYEFPDAVTVDGESCDILVEVDPVQEEVSEGPLTFDLSAVQPASMALGDLAGSLLGMTLLPAKLLAPLVAAPAGGLLGLLSGTLLGPADKVAGPALAVPGTVLGSLFGLVPATLALPLGAGIGSVLSLPASLLGFVPGQTLFPFDKLFGLAGMIPAAGNGALLGGVLNPVGLLSTLPGALAGLVLPGPGSLLLLPFLANLAILPLTALAVSVPLSWLLGGYNGIFNIWGYRINPVLALILPFLPVVALFSPTVLVLAIRLNPLYWFVSPHLSLGEILGGKLGLFFGALAGSIVPGIGTLIGGMVGAVVGWILGDRVEHHVAQLIGVLLGILIGPPLLALIAAFTGLNGVAWIAGAFFPPLLALAALGTLAKAGIGFLLGLLLGGAGGFFIGDSLVHGHWRPFWSPVNAMLGHIPILLVLTILFSVLPLLLNLLLPLAAITGQLLQAGLFGLRAYLLGFLPSAILGGLLGSPVGLIPGLLLGTLLDGLLGQLALGAFLLPPFALTGAALAAIPPVLLFALLGNLAGLVTGAVFGKMWDQMAGTLLGFTVFSGLSWIPGLLLDRFSGGVLGLTAVVLRQGLTRKEVKTAGEVAARISVVCKTEPVVETVTETVTVVCPAWEEMKNMDPSDPLYQYCMQSPQHHLANTGDTDGSRILALVMLVAGGLLIGFRRRKGEV